jgi:hypothetical protein
VSIPLTVTPPWHTALMMNLLSESVSFEVCESFRAAIDNDEPVCAGCGHLAQDHERLVAA